MNAKQKSNPELNKDDFFHLTSYIWIVKDFQDVYSHMETSQFILSERFYSPSTPLTKEGQEKKDDNIWRFLLYPRGKVGVPKEHMSLFLFPLPNEYDKQRRIFYRQAIYRIEIFVNNNETCTNISSIHFYYDRENTIEICSPENNPNESIIPSSSFENYFNDDSFSDITFKFNCGSEIRASRLVLAMKSSYFKALFQGNWKESKSPVISIKDVNFECFKRMIYFLYSGRLDNELSFEELKDLYIEADVRDISDLKREGSKRIVRLVDETSWDEILLMGWQTKNLEMKEAGLKYFSENWMNIKNSDKMNNIISNANFDWLDELFRAKLFGV
ncbi:11411_t:CDS:2 [Funneliformis caledonium]|uniref:11411_t:CDS:1 n=1 Tax=Funneliformis caledonium TaxID=1117310 RepID=A0A9N9E6Z2_9GLOM|nr:11411_t:CDS:2 [Funneliformis caledonium]